jgi:isoleucyl-tRNA synthetase
LVRRLASLGRSARAKEKIKVRQPLAELVVDVRFEEERGFLEQITPLLLEELNVKAVKDARDSGGLAAYVIKPNLRILGPKYGKDLGKIRNALENVDGAAVATAVDRSESIEVAGFTLSHDEVLVEQTAPGGYSVASEAGYSAGVSTAISPELKAEGAAREIVHLVQNLRKDAGFDIADRIHVFLTVSPEVQTSLESNESYLREETLSLSVTYGPAPAEATVAEHNIDGDQTVLGVVNAA